MKRFKLVECLRRRGGFLLGAGLALVVLWVCFSYLKLAQTPPSGWVMGPGTEPGAWTFTLTDGTAIKADEEGNFQLPEDENTLYCSRVLPEVLPPYAVLEIWGSSSEAAFFVDGVMIANPSRRFRGAEGFSDPVPESGSSYGLVPLMDAGGKCLTVAVQFLQDNPRLGALPYLTIYGELLTYTYQGVTAGAAAALPAGAFLAAALFLMGLFLYLLWKGRTNWGLLFLAGSNLAFCLEQTVTYALYTAVYLQTPVAIWFTQILPSLFLLWMLWYRTSGRVRRYGWLLPLGLSATCILLTGLALADRQYPGATNLLQGKILPLTMLLFLLESAWEARLDRQGHRRFWKVYGSSLGLAVVWAALFRLLTGTWPGPVELMWTGLEFGSLFFVMNGLSYLLLLTSFLLEVYSFVQETARRDIALQTTILQKRYTEENAAVLLRSLEDTRQARHEIRHHMEAVRALCQTGDLSRVQEYTERLCGSLLNAPAIYTKNPLVNVLLSTRLDQARKEGIRVHHMIRIPERLDIEDADLATFLTNLLDNAVEAASTAGAGRKFLTLRMALQGRMLLILCENGFDGPLCIQRDGLPKSSKKKEGHGYGLRVMRGVAQKYGGFLKIHHEDGRFQVKAQLTLRSGEQEEPGR